MLKANLGFFPLDLFLHSNSENREFLKQDRLLLRNANQNYNEVSPHTSPNGHHQKIYKQ